MADGFQLPQQLVDSVKDRLQAVRNGFREWKAYQLVNFNQEIFKLCWTSYQITARLEDLMSKIASHPVVIVEPYDKGAVLGCVTFIELLESKRPRMASGLQPPFYFAFYPREELVFSTQKNLASWARKVLLEFSGAVDIEALALQGHHIPSLRELHFYRKSGGLVSWQPVPCRSFLDDSDSDSQDDGQSSIIDLDAQRKQVLTKQYRQHFNPESDPQLKKVSFKVRAPFGAADIIPGTEDLETEMEITLESDNLSTMIEGLLEEGILPRGIPPYLQNVYKYGRTQVSLKRGQFDN